jgi:hypothetical protein
MSISPRSLLAATLAIALFTAPAFSAPVDYTTVSGHPMSTKTKTVQLLLKNNTGVAIDVRDGESLVHLAPGQTVTVKFPIGTSVVAETATEHHKVGDVLVAVSTALNGSTVVIS